MTSRSVRLSGPNRVARSLSRTRPGTRQVQHCRRLVHVIVASALLLFSSAVTVPAAPLNANDNARLAIHLLPAPSSSPCNRADAAPGCAGILTNGGLAPNNYYACVLITNADAYLGLAGVQFGIAYDGRPGAGVDVFSWTHCGALEFASPGWPGSSTGNMITWDRINDCQRTEPAGPGTGVVALVGYFYMTAYSPDRLRIMPRPVDNMAKV